ncbi:MAG TPA: thioesterase family protein [Myxococcota bacterium]|jgi:acyl-CoA thioester hydrolase
MNELAEFPVIVDVPVRWGDMDAYGHVNNAMYLTYFEVARLEYFSRLQLPGWTSPVGVGPIVHSTTCRYRLPVTVPDTLQVGARMKPASLAADRFTVHSVAFSTRHQRVAAEGDCVVVVFDYASGQKSSVTDELRAAIARVEQRGA